MKSVMTILILLGLTCAANADESVGAIVAAPLVAVGAPSLPRDLKHDTRAALASGLADANAEVCTRWANAY